MHDENPHLHLTILVLAFRILLSKSWNYSNSIHFPPRSYVIWCVVPDTWKEKKSREQLSSILHLKQMFLLTARLHSNYKILIFSSLLSLSFESSLPKRTRNMKFNFVLRETFPSLLPQLPLGSFIIDWTKRKKIGETEKKILQRTREKRRRNKFNPE